MPVNGLQSLLTNPSPSDFKALTGALYKVVSSPPGQRQWPSIRDCYHKDARLVRTGRGAGGQAIFDVQSFDQYLLDVDAKLKDIEFRETEVTHQCQVFGQVAQVSSVYEYQLTAPGHEVNGRGVNFLTLVFDTTQWRIMSIIWDNERPGLPLPQALIS
ncbi:MAG: hypothetical protein AB8B96_05215 [Lysobacterales bacterium]